MRHVPGPDLAFLRTARGGEVFLLYPKLYERICSVQTFAFSAEARISMKPHLLSALAVVLCATGASQTTSAQTWNFAVAGDSRNCGDVVMPAIAQHVHRSNAAFYW